MDSQDQSSAVSAVIKILRRVTRIVQIAPFAYLCFYAVYMLFGYWMSEEALCLLDSVFSASPVTIGGMLVASRLLKLCVWHKAACLIPAGSQLESCIDSFIVTFTQQEIIFINAALGILAVAFTFLAIRHFSHGFKRTLRANA